MKEDAREGSTEGQHNVSQVGLLQLTGAEAAHLTRNGEGDPWLGGDGYIDTAIFWIFVAEVVIKILANGAAPWLYFVGPERAWNNFDFFIVMMSIDEFTALFLGGGTAHLHGTLLANSTVDAPNGIFEGALIFNGARIVYELPAPLGEGAGVITRHPNMRLAYVAQHAFHHIENHLDKTPVNYLEWRFAGGMDREGQAKNFLELTEEEEMIIGQKPGQIEKLVSRRKGKKGHEYEVQYVGCQNPIDDNSWMSKELSLIHI